jgi:hypothetical protein
LSETSKCSCLVDGTDVDEFVNAGQWVTGGGKLGGLK